MKGISLVVIKTTDIEKLAGFYEGLGLEFTKHRHGKGPTHYCYEFERTGLVFEIYPLPKGVKHPDITTRLGFYVEKVDQLVESLKSRGVEIVKLPMMYDWGYSAIVKDIDGRVVELTEVDDCHLEIG